MATGSTNERFSMRCEYIFVAQPYEICWNYVIDYVGYILNLSFSFCYRYNCMTSKLKEKENMNKIV